MKIKGVIEDLKFLKKFKKKERMIVKIVKKIYRTFSDVVVGIVGSVYFRLVTCSSLYSSAYRPLPM